MYIDGMLGNRSSLQLLAIIIAKMHSFMSGGRGNQLTLEDILGTAWGYYSPPLTAEELKKKSSIEMANGLAQFGGLA